VLAGKVHALRGGRFAVSADDVLKAALPALRHRVLLNFEGLGEGLTADDLVREIVERRATLEAAR
jgi:MoxR-like ATPase